jgi:hypothetical protein
MKQTITRYDFERAFVDADRKENFSYEGLGLLFAYFEEIEESIGEEIELDVIAICCEYAEDTISGIAENYGLELPEDETEDEHRQAVFDYLSSHTSVVGDTADGFVYQIF